MLIIEILLGIVVAIFFYNIIHHYLVKLPNQKRQLRVKKRIDGIVPIIMNTLKHDQLIPIQSSYVIKSKPLSKIWGRDIFAYEYVLCINFSNQKELLQFRNRFNDTLISYCKAHGITTQSGISRCLVADAWKYRRKAHLDVACIYNSATIDYLKDIHRL